MTQRKHVKIVKENQHIAEKMTRLPSIVDFKKAEQDFQAHVSHLARITNFAGGKSGFGGYGPDAQPLGHLGQRNSSMPYHAYNREKIDRASLLATIEKIHCDLQVRDVLKRKQGLQYRDPCWYDESSGTHNELLVDQSSPTAGALKVTLT